MTRRISVCESDGAEYLDFRHKDRQSERESELSESLKSGRLPSRIKLSRLIRASRISEKVAPTVAQVSWQCEPQRTTRTHPTLSVFRFQPMI